MVWCGHCSKNVHMIKSDGVEWCELCGKVFATEIYSDEPTFTKNSAGQSQLSGRIVRSTQSEKPSRQILYDNARYDFIHMRDTLEMGEDDEIIDIALRFYQLAVEKSVVMEKHVDGKTIEEKDVETTVTNFTKGRRTELVRASCLYIACREKRKPYLLIEFSEYLKINVYVLGAVFLQLCEYLRIDDHPNYQRPVDPSLFIHRFTGSLLGRMDKGVIQTAKTIITSMKRNWMQTGRKPSGLFGAALYLSALLHGYKLSKSDITRTVHVCHATLTKRLVEFENTESGSLKIEEFLVKEKELEELSEQQNMSVTVDEANKDAICGHEGSKPFKYRLCQICYDDMMTISGGFEGGLDPPAFQRSEMERMEKASAEVNANDFGGDNVTFQSPGNKEQSSNFEEALNSKLGSGKETLEFTEPESVGTDTMNTDIDTGTEASDESGNFSDIDDREVDGYLLDEEEQRNKTIIWEELNGGEEPAAKAKKTNGLEDAAAAKKRKERKLAREAEFNNSAPAQTAAEAAKQLLTKKGVSSKINFDALQDDLFEISGSPKKRRIDSNLEDSEVESDANKKKYDDDAYGNDDMGPENEHEDETIGTMSIFDYDYAGQDYDEDYS